MTGFLGSPVRHAGAVARRAAIAVAVAAAMVAGPGAWAQDAIGQVKATSGFVQVVRDGRAHVAELGEPVYRKDELITGRDGALGVTFRDGSRLSLGPTSRLRLESFEFDPAERKLGFFARMAHGTLHVISGLISKLAPDAFSVETPVATIAVRGTNFAIRVPKEGS